MSLRFLDLGTQCCVALLDAVASSAAEIGIEQDGMPKVLTPLTGANIPVADACDGMVWARIANVMPTDGSGAQLTVTKWDSSVPAWLFPIEVGVLWCHTNITADGSWIDPAEEAGFAERDATWRMIIQNAVAYVWRAANPPGTPIGDSVLAQTISPWTPIGPDGGYSGGLQVLNVIARGLAVPA